MKKKILLAATAASTMATLHSQIMEYQIFGGVLSDGGTLSGNFNYNISTGIFSNINLFSGDLFLTDANYMSNPQTPFSTQTTAVFNYTSADFTNAPIIYGPKLIGSEVVLSPIINNSNSDVSGNSITRFILDVNISNPNFPELNLGIAPIDSYSYPNPQYNTEKGRFLAANSNGLSDFEGDSAWFGTERGYDPYGNHTDIVISGTAPHPQGTYFTVSGPAHSTGAPWSLSTRLLTSGNISHVPQVIPEPKSIFQILFALSVFAFSYFFKRNRS
jgi:hypothetical protein